MSIRKSKAPRNFTAVVEPAAPGTARLWLDARLDGSRPQDRFAVLHANMGDGGECTVPTWEEKFSRLMDMTLDDRTHSDVALKVNGEEAMWSLITSLVALGDQLKPLVEARRAQAG